MQYNHKLIINNNSNTHTHTHSPILFLIYLIPIQTIMKRYPAPILTTYT